MMEILKRCWSFLFGGGKNEEELAIEGKLEESHEIKNIKKMFVDTASDFLSFYSPETIRRNSEGIMGKLLQKYHIEELEEFVKKCQPYKTWDRQMLGRMVLKEGMETVLKAFESAFSGEIIKYQGALKEKLELDELGDRGGMVTKKIVIGRGNACDWYSLEFIKDAERWGLKGYFDKVPNEYTEIMVIQGSELRIRGFIKNLLEYHGGQVRLMIRQQEDMKTEKVFKTFEDLYAPNRQTG